MSGNGAAGAGPHGRDAALVGILSVIVIVFQITVSRLFAFVQWPQVATAVVGMAMLGFGVSGVVMSAVSWRDRPAVGSWACAAGAASAFSIVAVQRLPFEPFLILWRPAEGAWLLVGFLLVALPISLWALALAALIFRDTKRLAARYAAGFLGNALGAPLCLGVLLPLAGIGGTLALCSVGSVACGFARGRRHPVFRWGCVGVTALLLPWLVRPVVSETKARSRLLLLPEARIERAGAGARGIVEVVHAPSLRSAEGLSLRFEGDVPVQPVLLKDGDVAGPLPVEAVESDAYAYLEWLLPQLAYESVSARRVFLVGSGGGSEIVRALRSGASEVWIAEPVQAFRRALERRPVGRDPRLRWWHGSPRDGLLRAGGAFDLIQVTATGSSGEAAVGVHAASEQFDTTIEAMRAYLNALDEDGVLLVARWRQDPPRETARLLANALRSSPPGKEPVAPANIVGVETWAMAGLLVRPRSWDPAELGELREQAGRRDFEAIETTPGDPPCALVLQGLPPDALRGYDLRPTTDARPYLGWTGWARSGAAPEIGVVAAVRTFAQSCGVAAVLLVAPVVLLRARDGGRPFRRGPAARGSREHRAGPTRTRTGGAFATCLMFGGLGAGFALCELALIQRWRLYTGDPAIALGMVLGGLLAGSGLGSLLAGRRLSRWNPVLACAVAGLAPLLVILAADRAIAPGSAPAPAARFAAGLLALLAAGVPLGIPFPLASTRIRAARPALVPWLWSANGALSVVGSMAAPILLAAGGVGAALGASALAYGVAAGAWALMSGTLDAGRGDADVAPADLKQRPGA